MAAAVDSGVSKKIRENMKNIDTPGGISYEGRPNPI
jgi:hypothetical protein